MNSILTAFLLLFNPIQEIHESAGISLESALENPMSVVNLFENENWFYHPGDDPSFAEDSTFSGQWRQASLAMRRGEIPHDWDGLGWFAGTVRIDSTLYNKEVSLWGRIYGGMEVYIDGELAGRAGEVGRGYQEEKPIGLFYPVTFSFGEKDHYFIAIRYSNHNYRKVWDKAPSGPLLRVSPTEAAYYYYYSLIDETRINRQVSFLLMGILAAFVFLHVLLFFFYPPEKANLVYSLLLLSYFFLVYSSVSIGMTINPDLFLRHLYIEGLAVVLISVINIYFVYVVTQRKINWIPAAFTLTGLVFLYFVFSNPVDTRRFLVMFSYASTITAILFFLKDRIVNHRREYNVIIAAYIIYFILVIPRTLLISTDISILWAEYQISTQIGFIFIPAGYSIYLARNFALINQLIKDQLRENEKLSAEKQKLVEEQKEELEREVLARTSELDKSNRLLMDSLEKLTSAQDQLIQQEKLASLGQLTAGIAHEIKNPLNFVNNFSDVSLEMIDEALEELQQIGGNEHAAETASILADIKSNLRKIHEHGSRADGIVKSMLQHSRGGDGKMEPTPLNPLIKEYVNLAFQGMRSGKDPINVDIDLKLDENVGDVPLIAEDFSRVILNLCNNAFDACVEQSRSAMLDKAPRDRDYENHVAEGRGQRSEEFTPKLTVRTYQTGGTVTIEIEDNGPGIPDEIKDKILQPFFTTKKGTAGTGLGLSITNDIVKAHGGSLEIHSQPGQTVFTIKLNM